MANPDPVIKLASRARALNRRIYASLPYGYRVANLLLKLAAGSEEAFGRFVYAQFVELGVTDMPEVRGMPAESFKGRLKGPRGPDRLPRGYGHAFGKRAFNLARSKFGVKNMEVIETGAALLYSKFLRGKVYIQEGTPLPQAEKITLAVFMNSIRDAFDSFEVQNRGTTSLGIDPLELDLYDPDSWREVEQAIPANTLSRIMNEVGRIHPRAADWVEAKLEGLSSRDIASEWGISAPRVSQIEKAIVPRIYEVFQKYLEAAA